MKCQGSFETEAMVNEDDYEELKSTASNSHNITTIKKYGYAEALQWLKNHKGCVLGAFLLGAFIFYQSIFVAEIRVYGYRSIAETEIRQTLRDAGLFEGCKKRDDYSSVKAAVFDEFENVTWVSIFEEGRLIKVTIAEGSKAREAKEADKSPVNVVANKSGMIEKVLPIEGNAVVKKGDYVNEGDLLISGKIKYKSTDYSKGDKEYVMYSHAQGHVYAKVPEKIAFYIEKNRRIKTNTGRWYPGIHMKIGELEVDTAGGMTRYEVSQRKENTLVSLVKPLPLYFGIVRVEEVELGEDVISRQKAYKVVNAAIREYEKSNYDGEERVLTKEITLLEEERLIRADVFIEALEDVGREVEIKKDKKKR